MLAIISAASMAGIPPLFGFVAKESVPEAVLHEELLLGMPRSMMLVAMVVGSVLTMAYSLHFLYGAFCHEEARARQRGGTSDAVVRRCTPSARACGWPRRSSPPAPSSSASGPGRRTPSPCTWTTSSRCPRASSGGYLALWHGFTLPLLLSAIIIVGGVLMHWQRDAAPARSSRPPALGSADAAYDKVLDFFRRVSLAPDGVDPAWFASANLSIIFGVLIALPLAALVLGDRNDVRMVLDGRGRYWRR
ncbi:hypothetical protein QP028_09525 [Corynebacterium suedekumii]|nr:hypothetical protein QP028_09525 [Corynebacterium suedekumii]